MEENSCKKNNKIGFVKFGTSELTSSANLPTKSIINNVGSLLGKGNDGKKLSNAINVFLELSTLKAFIVH